MYEARGKTYYNAMKSQTKKEKKKKSKLGYVRKEDEDKRTLWFLAKMLEGARVAGGISSIL